MQVNFSEAPSMSSANSFFLLFFLLDGPKKTDNEDDIYGGSTDDEPGEPNQNEKTGRVSSPLTPKETSSSDRDTEDELKR